MKPRKQQSIAEARSNLPQLVREAEEGEPIELTRRGKSVAVLIGREHYERLQKKTRGFSEAWKEFSNEVNLAVMKLDPDELFGNVRGCGSAPGVSWKQEGG